MLCLNRSIRYTILALARYVVEQHVGLTRTAAAACRARRPTHRSSDTLRAGAPRHVSLANTHKNRLSEARRLAGVVDFRRFVVRCQACDRTRFSVFLVVGSGGKASLVLVVIIGVHHSAGILTKIAHAGPR